MLTNSELGCLVVLQGVLWQGNHFLAGMLCGLAGALLIAEDLSDYVGWRTECLRIQRQCDSAPRTLSTARRSAERASAARVSRS